MTRGDRVRLISRWGDVLIGALGTVVRSYADPGGRRWVRVEWCRTLDGKPVRLTYPAGVLALVGDEPVAPAPAGG
ncbi:MAG: hypothetical protein ACRCU1_19005 [Alsobacter sp.]